MTARQIERVLKPAERNPGFTEPGLVDRWKYSSRLLNQLSALIESIDLPRAVACVAVSGSLARMEAHTGSDLDLLIVVDQVTSESKNLWQTVWTAIEADPVLNHLRRPKTDGIFSKCASIKATLDPQVRGQVSESMDSYGHRMQLLLDSQPVFNDVAFRSLQTSILDWATEDRLAEEFQQDRFHWFRHEVHRYWHSIAARATYLNRDRPAANRMTNVKLRSSRRLLIAAALRILSGQHHGREIVEHWLPKTPLERILPPETDTRSVHRLPAAYAGILQYLAANKFHQPVPPAVVADLNDIQAATSQICS